MISSKVMPSISAASMTRVGSKQEELEQEPVVRRARREERVRAGRGREREVGEAREARRTLREGLWRERRREWVGREKPSEETSQKSGGREEREEVRRERWREGDMLRGHAHNY